MLAVQICGLVSSCEKPGFDNICFYLRGLDTAASSVECATKGAVGRGHSATLSIRTALKVCARCSQSTSIAHEKGGLSCVQGKLILGIQ